MAADEIFWPSAAPPSAIPARVAGGDQTTDAGTAKELPGVPLGASDVRAFTVGGTSAAPADTPRATTTLLTLEQLEVATTRLEPGATRDDVLNVLGPPTLAESMAAGQKSPSGPFMALVWRYERTDTQGVSRRLDVVFQKDKDWLVNSWTW